MSRSRKDHIGSGRGRRRVYLGGSQSILLMLLQILLMVVLLLLLLVQLLLQLLLMLVLMLAKTSIPRCACFCQAERRRARGSSVPTGSPNPFLGGNWDGLRSLPCMLLLAILM